MHTATKKTIKGNRQSIILSNYFRINCLFTSGCGWALIRPSAKSFRASTNKFTSPITISISMTIDTYKAKPHPDLLKSLQRRVQSG